MNAPQYDTFVICFSPLITLTIKSGRKTSIINRRQFETEQQQAQ